MGNRSAGPGTPVNLEQRVRYQPAINKSSYDCPPFGVMSRVYLNGTGGEMVDGSWVTHVFRPDATIAARQSAADLVFNGPEVMLAGRPGRVTEDFPCRGLHLRDDTLHQRPIIAADGLSLTEIASIYCGPKADSFLLWDSGFAFRWLHADGSIVDDKFETGVVVPTPLAWIGGQFQVVQVGGNSHEGIEPDDTVGTDGSSGGGSFGYHPTWTACSQNVEPYSLFDLVPTGSGENPAGIRLKVGGIYEWHFHCTLKSATAPQGSGLTLRGYLDDTALYSYCSRAQQNEIDSYGNEIHRSLENVAMSGTLFATADQVLNFRNVSAYQVSCYAIFCTIRRTGP